MGGEKRFAYPVDVWTPYGGWWPEGPSPRRNRRNFILLNLGLLFFVYIPVFYASSRLERRFRPPTRTIPSQLWCKYADIDDPKLAERRGRKVAS